MKKVLLAVLIAIPVIGCVVLAYQWNVIWGYQSCRSGDYAAAVEHYKKLIDEKRANEKIKNRYDALTVYLSADGYYNADDMESLSKSVTFLKNTDSEYPTEAEIKEVENKYVKRNDEILSYNKSIEEISALFSDTNKINTIAAKCDSLLKKNITYKQSNKLTEMKSVAAAYIDIKNSYDKSDYSGVIEKITKMPDIYKDYPIKDSMDNMKKEAQKVLEERKVIDAKLTAVRNSFNSGNYDGALSSANVLLTMNLTDKEKEEVQTIKTTSEQKIAEEKAAAEQAAKEARQKMLDSAIKISATSLFNEFTENKVSGDAKYKNKVLLVTGTVYKIDKAWLVGTPYIELQAGYVADGVVAYFSSDTASQLVDIAQGQTVRVLGKCGGRSFGRVVLNDCSIVK